MKRIIMVVMLVASMNALYAQNEVFTKSNVAIQGYDPVAYFKESKPVKGDAKYSYSWKGVTWHFSSAENRDVFKADSEKYAPQFGGYCAYGTADGDGHKASTSPDAWTIVDGKLYLNYNKEVQQLWKKGQAILIERANKNWPEVKKQKD